MAVSILGLPLTYLGFYAMKSRYNYAMPMDYFQEQLYKHAELPENMEDSSGTEKRYLLTPYDINHRQFWVENLPEMKASNRYSIGSFRVHGRIVDTMDSLLVEYHFAIGSGLGWAHFLSLVGLGVITLIVCYLIVYLENGPIRYGAMALLVLQVFRFYRVFRALFVAQRKFFDDLHKPFDPDYVHREGKTEFVPKGKFPSKPSVKKGPNDWMRNNPSN